MKIFSKVAILIIFSLGLGLVSCIKNPELPIEPIIKFEEFKKFGKDSAWFIFSFTDGDGDIGLKPSDIHPPFDTSSVHYYNFFMDYYEKQGDDFVKIDTEIPFSYRIPYLTPEGRNKALEGEIVVRLPFQYFDDSRGVEVVRYDAWMFDRALHKSNVISTGEIWVPN
ncbi:MAG: hypothetical protein H0X62_09480 [Bacteroidetes bacterium]|nr:hypothetical protein [Bacteroidota bacterium]